VAASKLQSALTEVVATLARKGQPQTLYGALDRSLGKLIGHKLFTLMIFDERQRQVQRVYSNQPKTYPVGGKKPYSASTLYDELLVRHRPCVLHNADDIKRTFADHKLILSLRCAASLHIPVVYDGRPLGLMNLLNKEGWYRDKHIAEAAPFGALLVAPFMLALRG
jgi:transcriptional regulator with GAF, ATPase, and Fis domain